MGQLIGAGIRRRRLKGSAIAGVLFIATAAATLAFTVVAETQAPFDSAFAAADGAHLVIDYDATRTTSAAVAATAGAVGVTAAGGPWLVGPVTIGRASAAAPTTGSAKGGPSDGGSAALPQVESGTKALARLEARDVAEGPLDRLTIAGRWWSKAGEIVLSQDTARQVDGHLGDTLTLSAVVFAKDGVRPTAPGTPTRTVMIVGIAGSISTPAIGGWLSPVDLSALTAGTPTELEMLYRVQASATPADLTSATSSITHDMPADAVIRSVSYLTNKVRIDRTAALMAPILIGFSVFALGAAMFIVVNVIGGIVVASGRDLGLLASVGFTPGQIRTILVGQIVIPAALGAGFGLAVGALASQPLVDQAARGFGLPSGLRFSPEVIAGVGGAAAVTVLVAAVLASARLGRGGPVAALSRATAPSSRAGHSRLARAISRSGLSPVARLGLGRTVGNPLRTSMVTGAVIVGVAAVVFGVGLDLSIRDAVAGLSRDQAAPVRIDGVDGANATTVTATLAADRDVARFTAIGSDQVAIAGVGEVVFDAYQGDASWTGYVPVEGRWFAAPGEVDLSDHLLAALGRHVGDRITLVGSAGSAEVTIVGTIFDQEQDVVRGDWATLQPIAAHLAPDSFEIQPAAGVDPEAVVRPLQDLHLGDVYQKSDSTQDVTFLLFEGVVSVLAFVLVAISLGGVLDTLLLETRERMRETAILKVIGMTPRQVTGMVLVSVIPIGVVAGLIGVPAGILLDHAVLGEMGRVATDGRMPAGILDPLGPAVALLALAGIAIAVLGAWIPAGVASRMPVAPVLQAE
ncbi:MAG TPA: ABC transporter permease [Candidatus Acidoferrum sp.]|nr:ABC transporter permease [Candidatus Acidoferrum sp.]